MLTHFQNNLVTELPDITNIEFKKIDKSYFKVVSINFCLFFLPLFFILILLHKFVFENEVINYIYYIYTLFLLFFGVLYLYLYLGFSKRKYAIREKDISYKEGLFVKRITTVPFSRIQHVEIDEKPISRIFGLSSISVYTAGDSSDDLEINGVKKEVGLKIKEFISSKING